MPAKTGLKRYARIYQRKHLRKKNRYWRPDLTVKEIAHRFWLSDFDKVNCDMGGRGFYHYYLDVRYEQDPKLEPSQPVKVNGKIRPTRVRF